MGKATELSRRRFVGSALSAAALAALPASSMADAKMQKRGNEMTTLTPYLLFDGKCQQAMEFYKSCLAENWPRPKLRILQPKISCLPLSTRKSSMPGSEMASWRFPRRTGCGLPKLQFGATRFASMLSGGTLEELKTLFKRLSDGAEVTDPLKEQFFGTYGALNDKFGVRWMFQTDKKP